MDKRLTNFCKTLGLKGYIANHVNLANNPTNQMIEKMFGNRSIDDIKEQMYTKINDEPCCVVISGDIPLSSYSNKKHRIVDIDVFPNIRQAKFFVRKSIMTDLKANIKENNLNSWTDYRFAINNVNSMDVFISNINTEVTKNYLVINFTIPPTSINNIKEKIEHRISNALKDSGIKRAFTFNYMHDKKSDHIASINFNVRAPKYHTFNKKFDDIELSIDDGNASIYIYDALVINDLDKYVMQLKARSLLMGLDLNEATYFLFVSYNADFLKSYYDIGIE